MNFWAVIFTIYIFFTITLFFVSTTQAFEARRRIYAKVGKNYYDSFSKRSIIERIVKLLTSFFLSAIPILNFFVTFHAIIHAEEIINSSVQKWLTEHKQG